MALTVPLVGAFFLLSLGSLVVTPSRAGWLGALLILCSYACLALVQSHSYA